MRPPVQRTRRRDVGAVLLAWLPGTVGAAALAVCATATMANLVCAAAGLAAPVDLAAIPGFQPLVGVVAPVQPILTVASVLDGSFQTAVARAVGPRVPVFAGAVRLRNQVAYSWFGVSANPRVTAGRHGTLIETSYITEYCTRDPAKDAAFLRAWAPAVRRMQDVAERRGQTFLYVVTPSKPAQYPDVIPRGWPCPAPMAARQAIIPAWMEWLRQAGVHAVDTSAVLWAAHGRYPFPLFPPGGTHWNAVGARLAGQAVADGIERQRGQGQYPPLEFSWRLHPAAGGDTDLVALMNLLAPPAGAPVPQVTVASAAPPPVCRAEVVVIVGGSFTNTLAQEIGREPCHPVAIVYEYWAAYRLSWRDGMASQVAVDPVQRARDLAAADILIYEANEEIVHGPYTGEPLYEHLVGQHFDWPVPAASP